MRNKLIKAIASLSDGFFLFVLGRKIDKRNCLAYAFVRNYDGIEKKDSFI